MQLIFSISTFLNRFSPVYLFYPSLHLHFTSYFVWNKIFQFTKINSKISGAYLGKYLRIIRTRPLRLCRMIVKKFVKRRNAIDWKPAIWQTFYWNESTDWSHLGKQVCFLDNCFSSGLDHVFLCDRSRTNLAKSLSNGSFHMWHTFIWRIFWKSQNLTLANKFVSLTIDFQVGSTTSFCVIAAAQIWHRSTTLFVYVHITGWKQRGNKN